MLHIAFSCLSPGIRTAVYWTNCDVNYGSLNIKPEKCKSDKKFINEG